MNSSVMIIDDEDAIRDMLTITLNMAGYKILEASSALDALSMIMDKRPDLILLDWMMPGMSGLELARRLKRDEYTRDIPLILLTAKGEEDNKIQGLETGADDYVTKPFAPRELVARMRAVLRRSKAHPAAVIEVEGLTLNTDSQRVNINQKPISMGPTEFRILTFFMTHPERAYSRTQLLDRVWGASVYVEERTVDVHIRRLRKALGSTHAQLIQTVRGTGYRFSTQRIDN